MEREACVVWDNGDGIVRMRVLRREFDLDASEQVGDALAEIRQGRKMPLVADNSLVRSFSREAREHGAIPEEAGATPCVAIVVGGPVSRVIASFFLRMNRPTFPVKVFDDPVSATSWARQFLPTEPP